MRTKPWLACLAPVALALAGPPARTAEPAIEWRLPRAEAPSPAVLSAMASRLEALQPDHDPRTEHLGEDGRPLYTNRLILEASPYLLQHAHNPVNWRPWGDEAFAEARLLDRPILLSVGYSTCHWCHVMERESFDDPEIAAVMNALYVAVKVDREERPDVDSTYMTAVQLLRRQGGWPMTVWLTPDGRPYYGGTYMPPRDGDRGAKLGFLTYLVRLRQAWDQSREDVERTGAELADTVRRYLEPATAPAVALPDLDLVRTAIDDYERRFDPTWGGLEPAPKFPASLSIRLLLRHHLRTGEPKSLEMVRRTLDAMAEGGIRDQVGGGFHRYSTDPRWLVPHFEKMLYDNALLAIAYVEAYQATAEGTYAEVARDVLDYLSREMASPQGVFHSATDADSLGPEGELGEGFFFTWTLDEMRDALETGEMEVASAVWGVDAAGDLEGRNVLHRARPLGEVAREAGLDEELARRLLASARSKLYAARADRPPPLRDDKILTAWNGLAVSAFARAGHVLDEPGYLAIAGRAADRLLDAAWVDGALHRYHLDGRLGPAAFLDDHAFLIAGLLDLYETTWEPRRLETALALQRAQDTLFSAPDGEYYRSRDASALGEREVPIYDDSLPSANACALANLLRLAELTTDDAFRERADRLLRAITPQIATSPGVAAEMLVALEFRLGDPREVVLIAPENGDGLEPFLDAVRRRLLPHRVLVVASEGPGLEAHVPLVPMLEGKAARDGRPTAYVCERGVCLLPTTDVEEFVAQLEAGARTEPGG